MTATKGKLKPSIQELVPSLHGEHTIINVAKKSNQSYLTLEYTYVGKDGTPTHYRAIDSNDKVHFLASRQEAPDHFKPKQVMIKNVASTQFVADLSTENGRDMLIFFLQGPYFEVENFENKQLITSIFSVEIRSLTIQGQWKTIKDTQSLSDSIMDLDDEQTNRLIYFLGGIGKDKTTVEKKIELIGIARNGLAMVDKDAMDKTLRFLNGENSEALEIESYLNEAVEMDIVREDDNGFMTAEGLYLGASKRDAITYYSQKPNALKKLQSEIALFKEKEGKDAILHDEEAVNKAIGVKTANKRKAAALDA